MQTVYLKHHLFINQLDSTEDTAPNKATKREAAGLREVHLWLFC